MIIIIIISAVVFVLLLRLRHPGLFLALFQKYTVLTRSTELLDWWIICRIDHTPTRTQIKSTIT